MAITKKTRRVTPSQPVTASRRMQRPASRIGYSAPRSINAGTSITAAGRSRMARPVARQTSVAASVQLTPAQRIFANQLIANTRRFSSITAATNTSNIIAKPDFVELLPIFVQKLLVEDIFGSVAMKSRQQIIPYFKVLAENTKGETARGDILSSAFVNRQGYDPNFTGRVVKNETVAVSSTTGIIAYTPILPGSVTLEVTATGGTVTKLVDDGAGNFVNAGGGSSNVKINYATGEITALTSSDTVKATYEYDNETVGPNATGEYGAQMGKVYLQLDEINLIAEAHQLASYWSIYSAFAAQQEYGANIAEISKEAAFSELTAEINSFCLNELLKAATYAPQYNWDASLAFNGAVMPSDFLNLFKFKLDDAANSVYQATNLARPNRLVVGTKVASLISRLPGFSGASNEETVGPYKLGTLDQYTIYVDPYYDPNTWVMCCKSSDLRRNSALLGIYMPMVKTDDIGLANASVQSGYCSMYATKIVNAPSVVSGKVLGAF